MFHITSQQNNLHEQTMNNNHSHQHQQQNHPSNAMSASDGGATNGGNNPSHAIAVNNNQHTNNMPSQLLNLMTNTNQAQLFQSTSMMPDSNTFLRMLGGNPLMMPNSGAQPNSLVASSGSNADFESNPTMHQSDVSTTEKVQQNRDRNREHARSTRLRKKAYVQKLKELVEGLHAERIEEVRQRRVAIQHMAEVQSVRRNVVRNFLRFLSKYETDERKWKTVAEENFCLKQPVTPYRSFRRCEIEKECRCSRGVQAMICEAASLAVMIENIGSRSSRWMQLKRDEFLQLEHSKRGNKQMPRCVAPQDGKLQHAVSSLSSNSGFSNNTSSGEDTAAMKKPPQQPTEFSRDASSQHAKKVSSSSGSSSDGRLKRPPSNEYHDYHARPLPDPKLGDSEESSPAAEDSPEESNENSSSKRTSTDSSSGDDSQAAIAADRPSKRRRHGENGDEARSEGLLPPNIAKKGGIPHNIRPVALAENGPTGIQQSFVHSSNQGSSSNGSGNGPAMISADAESSSGNSGNNVARIRASFHVNEDFMILVDNVLMCPFVFRSQDAVLCGALADCLMPGMLRASFSSRNKLSSIEIVYDAMGFMQQLERASGNEGSAQIIPGSLEMALAPTQLEARVITLAEAPFKIVNVNEAWTRSTGYTQMEVEGKEYISLLEGEGTVQEAKVRPGKPKHLLEEVAMGRPACSTNIHYGKDGHDYIEFVCSYPLTNSYDQITHILHVSKVLPTLENSLSKISS